MLSKVRMMRERCRSLVLWVKDSQKRPRDKLITIELFFVDPVKVQEVSEDAVKYLRRASI